MQVKSVDPVGVNRRVGCMSSLTHLFPPREGQKVPVSPPSPVTLGPKVSKKRFENNVKKTPEYYLLGTPKSLHVNKNVQNPDPNEDLCQELLGHGAFAKSRLLLQPFALFHEMGSQKMSRNYELEHIPSKNH